MPGYWHFTSAREERKRSFINSVRVFTHKLGVHFFPLNISRYTDLRLFWWRDCFGVSRSLLHPTERYRISSAFSHELTHVSRKAKYEWTYFAVSPIEAGWPLSRPLISRLAPWRVVCVVSTFRSSQWTIVISRSVTHGKRSTSDRKEIEYHSAKNFPKMHEDTRRYDWIFSS